MTKLEYPGMQPDAPWRAAAAERIEKLRKAELRVTVKDEAGKLVPGAEVSVRLTKHAFGFGTCVPAHLLVGPEADDKFKALIPELFNVVTLENDLKWQPLAGDWGSNYTLERAQAAVAWSREHGLSRARARARLARLEKPAEVAARLRKGPGAFALRGHAARA